MSFKNRAVGIVSLVEQMLSLRKRLADAKMASDKKTIEQRIKVSDRQINQLVYELYELTDEAIAVPAELRSALNAGRL